MKDAGTIELISMDTIVKSAEIYIEGTGSLVCHKMNARDRRLLTADDRKKIKEVPNPWEDIITSIHWRDPIPCEDTYHECNQEMFNKMLKDNAPCITSFGLKKSFNAAIVRNEIDKYATKFDNALNITADKGLVPFTFTEWSLDEHLMSPVKGSPIVCKLNIFSGWKAHFRIDYTEHVFSLQEMINVINLAGFGIGIGSGRTSGFGRYRVVDVK